MSCYSLDVILLFIYHHQHHWKYLLSLVLTIAQMDCKVFVLKSCPNEQCSPSMAEVSQSSLKYF
jgi:hypothetical protein